MLWLSDLQIDMTALKQMGDKDLKELGIPMVILILPSKFMTSLEK